MYIMFPFARIIQLQRNMARRERRMFLGAIVGLCITCLVVFPMVPKQDHLYDDVNENVQSERKDLSWFPSWSRSSSDDSVINHSARKCSSPLKVYMYDIPRKFNFGIMTMVDKNGDLPWGNHDAPPWTQEWEVNKQHSVEYWMTVYLLDGWDREDGKRAAIRVRDPEQADVFFVPFFASLSFTNFGIGMEGPGAELDKKLQEGVMTILLKSKWWNASQGRDHIIVVHHPNAFRHYRQYLNSSILIVADFGRYLPEIARLEKDVVAPYEHVVRSYVGDDFFDPYSQRPVLLYFQGRVHRKADGLVRAKLAKVLMNETDVHYVDSMASSEALVEATKGMRSSRFCLHPAGDTPSSCRLFDAIVSHCVPVIVSDRIELPFEDEINYNEFTLFFSSEDAVKPDHLLRTLRGIERNQWMRMWSKLKAVSHHFEFQLPAKKDDAVNMIFKQVQRKLPSMKRATHRLKRLKIADWW